MMTNSNVLFLRIFFITSCRIRMLLSGEASLTNIYSKLEYVCSNKLFAHLSMCFSTPYTGTRILTRGKFEIMLLYIVIKIFQVSQTKTLNSALYTSIIMINHFIAFIV